MKELKWLADARARVKEFPQAVRDNVGHGLYLAQLAETATNAKPLHGLGSGVMEIATQDSSGLSEPE